MDKFGNFDLVTRFKLDLGDIHVSKWRSRVTGLTIVHLDYDGMFDVPFAKNTLNVKPIYPRGKVQLPS